MTECPLVENPAGRATRIWLAIVEDAAFACRSLARAPTYTATMILTLALAIGGITAVFSALYAVVLRPLPFPDARELVALHTYYEPQGRSRGLASPSEFLDFRRHNRSFSEVAMLSYGDTNVAVRDGEEQAQALHVRGFEVSANFFRLLGVTPVLGRDFAPGEDQPGAPAVVLLSESFHRRAFDGAPDAVGKSIDINGAPHTIIGVLPEACEHLPLGNLDDTSTTPRDVWRPLDFPSWRLGPTWGQRNVRIVQVFGRLRPDVTLAAASADVDRIVESFYRDFPEAYPRDTGFGAYLEPLHDYTARLMGRVLWLLLGAVALLLLAACANAVSLSLARLASRRREIAVRVALGATTGRIALQFLIESAIVSLAAGSLGLLIGRAGMDGLLAVGASSLRDADVSFQLPVFVFALAVSGLTGVVAGVAPAWHAARLSPTRGLREGGRATSAGAHRLRSGLVVAQVSAALVLLACSGAFLRGIAQLTAAPLGFEPTGVYVGHVALTSVHYQDDADRRRLANRLLERLGATPGVESVAVASFGLFAGSFTRTVQIEGQPKAPWTNRAQVRAVSSGYFTTLGFQLVAGRFLGIEDTTTAPKVGVISELTAKKYFGGRNALGTRLVFFTKDGPVSLTVVGVVADAREVGLDKPVEPFIFVPFSQWPSTGFGIAVRAPKLGPAALTEMRSAVAEIAPAEPFHSAAPLQDLVDASLGPRRFTLLLLSVFAALSLSLSMLGVYGLLSYSVARRTPELAVRMAMGADGVSIGLLISRQAALLVGCGLLFGSILSAFAGRYLASQIYGLPGWDPKAAATIAGLLALVAAVASWLPARRASRVPLASALRTE